jgi:hypothetical protein
MENFTFIKRVVDPSKLYVHPKLSELGFDHRPDMIFTSMLKEFGLYERAVIDSNGAIITHSAEVLAAVENGVKEIDVYEVDMPLTSLMLFILLKHKYSKKNLIASYKIAAFLRDNIDLLNDLTSGFPTANGDYNVQIAIVMQTSDSTVKRLLRVGDKAYEKLGLIQEGETSFKQVIDALKLEQLQRKTEERRQSMGNSQVSPIRSTSTIDTVEVTSVSEEDGGSDKEEQLPDDTKSDDNEVSVSNQTNTGPIIFSSADMTFVGFGNVQINSTSQGTGIKINGKAVQDADLFTYTKRDEDGNIKSDSFVIEERKKDGILIQITVSNYSNAA